MFCPSCGEEKDKSVGKICLDCFISDKELVKVPDYLDVEYCVKCGSFKEGGGWREPDEDPKLEAAESAVMSSLGIHKEVESPRISLDPEVSGDQIKFDIEVFGEIRNEPVLLNASTKVRLDKNTCDRCSRIAGGYFESIVQVRGEDRDLFKEEMEDIREKVMNLVQENEGERMAFVAEIEEVDGGLDIYVGKSKLGQRIANEIINVFGGSYSQSTSLIGMKDGQEVHRVTYSIRLPPFGVGDLIKADGELIGIDEVGDVVYGIDLETGESFRRKWKYMKNMDIEKIGEKSDLKKGTISLVSGDEVQVIEPWDYENIVLKKPIFLDEEDEGKEVSLLNHNREFYLLPKNFA